MHGCFRERLGKTICDGKEPEMVVEKTPPIQKVKKQKPESSDYDPAENARRYC